MVQSIIIIVKISEVLLEISVKAVVEDNCNACKSCMLCIIP